jgi:hypothetical protein
MKLIQTNEERLAAWELTDRWLAHTARPIFGNIINAPQAPNLAAYTALVFKVVYLPQINATLNLPNPILELLRREAD